MSSIAHQPTAAVHNLGPLVGRTSKRVIRFGLLIVVLAILSGFATFFVLTGLTPIAPTHDVVVTTLLVNGVLLILLTLLIGGEVWRLARARRQGIAGARLHARIVGLFALVAALPAILVAIVASVTLDRSLDRWFSGRTNQIVENSAAVALTYLQEHGRVIRRDLIAVAAILEDARPVFNRDKSDFDRLVAAQLAARNLSGVYVIRSDLSIISREVEHAGDKFLVPTQFAIDRAGAGEIVVITPQPGDLTDQVGALVQLKNFNDTYLYLVRRLDAEVVEHLRKTAESLIEYRVLQERRFGVQVAFGLMYIGVTLILLMSSPTLASGDKEVVLNVFGMT
jgi:two-component system nitrogen regulation sensor histidine kinase NtrY